MPDFKYSLDGSVPKITSGGWAKESTLHQLPVSKGIAGVHMFLNPGASRELHWHAIAAEWAFVIDGRCQTMVLEPSGASEINNFEPGDLWYFAKGHGHSIQCIGDKPCHFILSFDNGAFSEHGTFSITDWIDVTPKEILAANFHLSKTRSTPSPRERPTSRRGRSFPFRKRSRRLGRGSRRTNSGCCEIQKQRAISKVALSASHVDEFPASKSMSGGLMIINRASNAICIGTPMRTNGTTICAAKGKSRCSDRAAAARSSMWKPGDAVYIPAGFGHAIKNTGDDDLEIVQTWDNPKFEEIDLDQWVRSSPNYLLANNFPGVPSLRSAK